MTTTNVLVRDPVLASYLEQLATIRDDARTLTNGLSATQLNWRSDPRRWSIGQCLEHLTLTVRLYPEKIAAMIEEARAGVQRGARPYREGMFTRWFIRSMEPPPKLRARTMPRVEPPAVLEPDHVIGEFDAAHAQLGALITAADGVSLTHGRTSSPFLPILRFTLNQVFAINLAHARRHLWQARQVSGHPTFPAE